MAKNLISVAGYDPSAGAGVLLDIAVFEGLGHRGFGVLTAVTAQNAGRVDRVMPVTARAVEGQFARLAEAVEVSGIKAGMLATAANLAVVAGILAGTARPAPGRRPRLPFDLGDPPAPEIRLAALSPGASAERPISSRRTSTKPGSSPRAG